MRLPVGVESSPAADKGDSGRSDRSLSKSGEIAKTITHAENVGKIKEETSTSSL